MYGLRYSNLYPNAVKNEFEGLITALKAFLLGPGEHDEEGFHNLSTIEANSGDGLGGVSSGSSSALLFVEKVLSAPEISTLYAAPVGLISAPGPNQIIVPLQVSWRTLRAGAAWTADQDISIKYDGVATILASINAEWASGGEIARHYVSTVQSIIHGTSDDPSNKTIVLTANVNSSAASSGALAVGVVYYVHSLT